MSKFKVGDKVKIRKDLVLGTASDFKDKKMYAGMINNKPYTLEQLGLEENND